MNIRWVEALRQFPILYACARMIMPRPPFWRRLFRPSALWPVLYAIQPISARYGSDRGTPIDRYYIEQFLKTHARYIRGCCLEVKDRIYTQRFGGSAVVRSDVLDINRSNARATVHDDLRSIKTIREHTYDCVILTQVLQFIDDCPAAIEQCHRILKPGGVLLVTVPFLSRVDIGSGEQGDFWRFTTASMRYLFQKHFRSDQLIIQSHGNILAGVGFWIGLSVQDCSRRKLDMPDKNFPLIISVCAIKTS